MSHCPPWTHVCKELFLGVKMLAQNVHQAKQIQPACSKSVVLFCVYGFAVNHNMLRLCPFLQPTKILSVILARPLTLVVRHS